MCIKTNFELTVISQEKKAEESYIYYAFNAVQHMAVTVKLHKEKRCTEKVTKTIAISERYVYNSFLIPKIKKKKKKPQKTTEYS